MEKAESDKLPKVFALIMDSLIISGYSTTVALEIGIPIESTRVPIISFPVSLEPLSVLSAPRKVEIIILRL